MRHPDTSRHLLQKRCVPALAVLLAAAIAGGESAKLEPGDVFELEYASDPQLSPSGDQVVYVRHSNDVMDDRSWANLWIIDLESGEQRSLTSGPRHSSSPRWSPDGTRLLYSGVDEDGAGQLFLRWMDTGTVTQLTNLRQAPEGASWAPDGDGIAFCAFVPEADGQLARMPAKPKGAQWAETPRVIERLDYRSDGSGYLETGQTQVFILPAEGGTPRQLTHGAFRHRGTPVWSRDGKSLIVAANRKDDWEYEPDDSDLIEISVADGSVRTLTERHGPDAEPALSPDGRWIAYTGYDERYLGFQVRALYVMERDGGTPRLLAESLDRSVSSPQWSGDGRSIFVQYSDRGNGKVAKVGVDGGFEVVAENVGGTELGRPYSSGSFSVGGERIAFTETRPSYPADIAVVDAGARRRLTHLNDDLLGHKSLATVEEVWWASSHDQRRIQGWIAKPPGWVEGRRYPLLLEIHGGPFADYGDRFAAEIQLYAAAGYVVLYCNPRGSTSYGSDFGNLIHHAYPSHDYDDLISGVDKLIADGLADPERLFVTGGSGGGVLSSWIIGHTDRFRAAAVQKPVINWYSWALTADIVATVRYWFPAPPWEIPQHYLDRSPISYVGEVETPTLLITGERDLRTPIGESEQFYQALKMRRVPAALVRIPEASHGIAARPSQLIAKVQHILAWFARYGGPDAAGAA